MIEKLAFDGEILAVQPRIRLTRSFDQASHSYLGYALHIEGTIDGRSRQFTVGIGKAAQQLHAFESGRRVRGLCLPVANGDLESVEFYKVSQLAALNAGRSGAAAHPPPWQGVPPSLDTYRERGVRRLATQTYTTACASCIWGCHMAVAMIIDHWNPSKVKYRKETFCYGPKSCPVYRPGPPRKVPGRRGMTWVEEDWVDEQDTRHREDDE